MRKIILFLIFSTLFYKNQAQNEIGLNFSNTILQNNMANPAFSPVSKVVVAIPSVSAAYYNSLGGLSVKNGKTVFNNSNNDGKISGNWEASFITIGFKVGEKGFLTLGQNMRQEVSLGGKSNFFKTLVEGNGQFVGQTIDFTPEINVLWYNEFSAAYAHQVGKWNFGGRAKYFTGISAIQTAKNSKLNFTTNPDFYQLDFDADYTINASQSAASGLGNLDTLPSKFIFNNDNLSKGFGLDLGATYQLTDKIMLSSSINNVFGSINWKNATAFNAKTKFTIDGLDVVKLATDTTFKIAFPNADTLFEKMKFTTTATSFKTQMHRNFTLMGSYKVTNFLTVSALYGASPLGSHIALNGTAHFRNWIETGLTYSVRNGSFTDIGANVAVKLGFFQIYFLADNLTSVVNPLTVNNFNARAGINFAFGKRSVELEPRLVD